MPFLTGRGFDSYAASVGLAVYFAERNTGAYHNMFMSFSGTSRIQVLKGETLAQKIGSINMNDWQNIMIFFRSPVDHKAGF